jgi:hypothetical protein
VLVSFFTSVLSWTLVTDEPTCYKVFTKACKPLLLLPPENGFEREPAATMLLLKSGKKYGEVPIHYKARKVNEGKKIKWKDGYIALKTLRKYFFVHLRSLQLKEKSL